MSVQIKGVGTIGGIDQGLNVVGIITAKSDIRLRRTASDDGALYFGDTNNNYIFGSDADDVITFATAGSERLRITSGGSVNLGTGQLTQTTLKFNVYGGGARVTQTAGGNAIEAFGHTTSGQSYGLLVNAGSTSADYAAEFRNKDATSLLRIRGDGKVGINQSTPTAELEVCSPDPNTTSTLFIHTPKHNTNVASEAILKFGYGHSGNPDGVGHIKMVEQAGNSFDADLIFGLPTNNSSGGSVTNERLRIKSNGAIGLSGANYGTSGQVLTSQGSGSAVQWATPSTSTDPTTGVANNNIWQTVGSNISWHTSYNNTDNTIGSVSNCTQSNVYAIDVKIRIVFNNGGGTYNYNSTHGYLVGFVYQDGKNYLNKGVYTEAQHFDMYYNVFGTVYTIPWDPSGTQNLKMYCTYAYNTNAQNYFNFQVINKWTR